MDLQTESRRSAAVKRQLKRCETYVLTFPAGLTSPWLVYDPNSHRDPSSLTPTPRPLSQGLIAMSTCRAPPVSLRVKLNSSVGRTGSSLSEDVGRS